MPQATFTPKFVNPPKFNQQTGQAARSATIRDSDGGYWGIHPGDMGKYQVGVPVTVEYRQNGKYFNVDSIVGQQAPANPQARLVQDVRPIAHAPNDGSTMPRQPNPQADEAKKSEAIFVTTVVQAAIAQQYPLEAGQLALLVQMARDAWRGVPRADPANYDGAPFPGSPDDNWEPDPRG